MGSELHAQMTHLKQRISHGNGSVRNPILHDGRGKWQATRVPPPPIGEHWPIGPASLRRPRTARANAQPSMNSPGWGGCPIKVGISLQTRTVRLGMHFSSRAV